MLKFLHIENIAVIAEADIELSKGLNVLTGETGAGKSIVIDSINAVLGERTSKELIRAGFDTAEVSAVFGELEENILKYLSEYGVAPDEDGNIIIKRRLSASGKGLIKINDKPYTATELREIGKVLINIHGQHDNQTLLDPEHHLDYVDLFCPDREEKLTAYYDEFKKLNKIRKELNETELDEDEKLRRTELLRYQINELKSADIKVGEYEELKKKLQIAVTYTERLKALSAVYNALKGDDEAPGAIGLVSEAQKRLFGINTEEWSRNAEKLLEATEIMEDVAAEALTFIESSEYEGLSADDINERLDFIDRLMLKYGNSEQALIEYLKNAEIELNGLVLTDKRIAELSEQLDASTERLVLLGERLTETRARAAAELEKDVTGILSYLNMPNVTFKVSLTKGKYTKRGADTAEFLISTNKGEKEKSLVKIASGGELSRVMLAIKSVLLDKDKVATMIFDEIDTGISGYTADKVGIQLKRVASSRQVICVTHLAQIAAMADNHLLIEKSTDKSRTYTKVEAIDGEQRISEIARIMSGTELTESLYKSAKELLDRSRQNENL